MADRIYYNVSINVKGYNRVIDTVYDTQDIIKLYCDLVNGYGIDPDNITIDTYINGKKEKQA